MIRRWMVRHPRFHVHFTPTGTSWINLVERWFAALTEKQIRRGVHRSTRELETAIRNYIDLTNAVFVLSWQAEGLLLPSTSPSRRPTSDRVYLFRLVRLRGARAGLPCSSRLPRPRLRNHRAGRDLDPRAGAG
jgi:hypothetical protein